MSDRPCNYCTWQRLKRQGYRIVTGAERQRVWEDEEKFAAAFGPGVVVVNKEGEFATWFMELPERCAC